jgi:ATP-binding cassette subfamily B protein
VNSDADEQIPQMKVSAPRTLGECLRILRKDAGSLIFLLIVLSLIRAFMPAVQIFATSQVINSVAQRQSASIVLFWAVVLAISLLIIYVLENILHYLATIIEQRVSFDVNMQIIDKTSTLEVQQYEDSETYDIIQRADSQTGSHIFGLFDTARSTIQSFISIFTVFSLLVQWNVTVAFVLLLAPVPGAIATFVIAKKSFDLDYQRATDQRLANYYRAILSSDNTIKETRLFGLASFFSLGYKKIIRDFFKQDLHIARYNLACAMTLGLITVFANAFAIVFGAMQTINGNGVGQLAAYITATSTLGQTVMAVFLGITGIYQHLLYASNWVALMDIKKLHIGFGRMKFEPNNNGGVEIRLDNVSFTYPGTKQKVLDHISCVFPAGQCSALVGLNGAGKSSIIKLILRFYEPTGGKILLDGIDIAQYSRESLYKHFSALFQDFTRYELSVRENIGFGDMSRMHDDLAIRDSLNLVGLEGLVSELPDGLDTLLGRHFNGGHQLSIGQWQRIAAGRAMFRNPSLLIMDEPTASVDAISEKRMFEAIPRMGKSMTTILVAHRFATISHAEHIVVINQGEVVGEGSHSELMNRCVYYRDLYRAQTDSLMNLR